MKLIIFANRADSTSIGGLSSLLSDHVNEIRNYEVFIIGWNGIVQAERQITVKVNNQETYITTNLTQWEYEEGYLNFHNRFLWPLCHRFFDFAHWSDEGYKANLQISQLFLSIAEDQIDSNTIVIVQDYHLIPLGQLIKNQFNIKVGFYLHIPMFDNTNLQKYNQQYIQELIQQFRAYDYIGFQRKQDVSNFITHIQGNRQEYDIEPYKLIDANDYKLCFNPVGINMSKFQNTNTDEGDDKIRFIFAGRYDYIKGHIQFLQCIYTLLEEQILDYKRVTILLIGGESRGDIKEYKDYQNQIQQLIHDINQEFGCVQELGKISRDRLAQILSSAENQFKKGGRQIVMCPSIMDGQNLIVHEAIASSLHNVVVSSIGSGCLDVIGKENILYLEQHDLMSFKTIIMRAINISMDDQIRNNSNVLMRLQGQFNSSKWLSNIMSNLNRKTLIFDIDGTISDFVSDPNDAFIHDEFFEFIDKTNHNIIILTGREQQSETNLTANKMLRNKLSHIVSDHGLIYQNEEEILEHPLVQQVQPTIKFIQREIKQMIENSSYLNSKKIVVENKYLGVTINVSQESKEHQNIILNIFTQILQRLVDNQIFTIANEHLSIELRPLFGKLEGNQYFLENKLKNEQIIFICDSLSPSGTDYQLANYLSLKGHQVWQVKNNKPDYQKAQKIFQNPQQLSQYLISNVV